MECSVSQRIQSSRSKPSFTMTRPNNGQRKDTHKIDVIHRGHSMMSSVTDEGDEQEEINHDRDSPVHHEQAIMIRGHGYDFSNVTKETKNIYQFGPSQSNHITIDSNLARLFKCMSLAYRGGKVVSPKWKNFKGMKLTVKDKIRLNNAIWRTWHIQYVMHRSKVHSLIQFATPLDAEQDHDLHTKPEAVVMEGKYWKRRIETVVAEYKKWRAFFMEKLRLSDYPGLTWVTEMENSPEHTKENRYMDDQTLADFSDTLFSNLSNHPFQFPNPREIAMHATNSDMIQPGLLQLQPMMEDMDFDPLQDFFAPPKKQISFTNTGFSQNENRIAEGWVHNSPNGMRSWENAAPAIEPLQQPEELTVQFTQQQHTRIISQSDPVFSAVNCDTAQNEENVQINQPSAGMVKSFPTQTMFPPKQQITMNTVVNHNPTHVGGSSFNNGQSGFSKISQTQLPTDRIIYTQPQTSMQMEFLQTPLHQSTVELKSRSILSINENVNQTHQVPNSNIQWLTSNQDTNYSVLEQQRRFVAELNNTAMSLQTQVNPAPLSQTTVNQGVDLLKQLLCTSIHNTKHMLPVSCITVLVKRLNEAKGHSTMITNQQVTTHVNPAAHISPYISPNKTETKQGSVVRMDFDTFDKASLLLYFYVSFLLTEQNVSLVEPMVNRTSSFSAEQKRRFNIKLGFTRLQGFIPGLTIQSNSKVSKATIMNKAAQYIKTMQTERAKMGEEIIVLKREVDALKGAISECQQKLPATGVPTARPSLDAAKSKFDSWVRERSKRDWKFYIFGMVVNPWFDSYQQVVSVAGLDELCRTVLEWIDQKCSLPALRPSVVQSLQVLGTTTSILQNPANLRQQIEEKVNYDNNAGNSR
uniref:BHLH domain-containing protein n=1 Tax=Ciona savignyi TaxID=51511 RepID=H2ZQI6_CIOSA